MATLNETDPVAEPDTPSLHQSSNHGDGIEVIASSSTSRPPPYTRNAPLDDPFRDYSNSNGMQKGLKRATTTDVEPTAPETAMLIRPLPAVPTDIVLDEEGLPPPLPYRRSGLSRGLQIPSRVSLITWGFSFPEILPEQGVSKEQWRLFKHELESFAYLTMSQIVTIVGCGAIVSHFFTILPGEYTNTASFHFDAANFKDRWRRHLEDEKTSGACEFPRGIPRRSLEDV